MNCKPGDIAVVVKPDPMLRALQGRIVKLKNEPPFINLNSLCWRLEEQLCAPVAATFVHGRHVIHAGEMLCGDYLPDAWLRPIRDHGDDAVDEMLLLAGKPGEVAA